MSDRFFLFGTGDSGEQQEDDLLRETARALGHSMLLRRGFMSSGPTSGITRRAPMTHFSKINSTRYHVTKRLNIFSLRA